MSSIDNAKLDSVPLYSPDKEPARPVMCFHCGEPVPESLDLQVRIDGEAQPMCCAGCQAVASAIIDLGLTDYYRHRQVKAVRPEDLVPAQLKKLQAYDDEVLQEQLTISQEGEGKSCSLLLSDMNCPACVWLIESRLSRLRGVKRISVNYSTQRAGISWDGNRVRLSEILQAIMSLGYRVKPYEPSVAAEQVKQEQDQQLRRLGVAGVLGMQVMMLSIAVYVGDSAGIQASYRSFFAWLCLILSTPVVVYSAQSFFLRAWRDLKLLRTGMDVPVSLGIAIAWLASIWATIRGYGTIYYDSVVMFVFFLLAARYLEFRGRRLSSVHVEQLAGNTPSLACRVTGTEINDEETIATTQVKVGDLLLVRPGEVFPADGALEKGETRVDESLVSGESLAIPKFRGDFLVGGSINLDQAVFVRVERTGQDTVSAHILRLIDRGQEIKPAILALANRVSAWFVFAVLLIALATATYWYGNTETDWLAATIAVLVVSCPCALALATPLAIANASTGLMKKGILLVNGNALETLNRVTDFIFDKTGTLTSGELSVQQVHCLSALDAGECLGIARALEKYSSHPVARAFKEKGDDNLAQPRVEEVTSYPSLGIAGNIDEQRYFLGSARFIEKYCDPDPDFRVSIKDFEARGRCVYLAEAACLHACFTLRDRALEGSKEAVEYLKQKNRRVAILSGDARQPTRTVAEEIGIEKYFFEQDPAQKMGLITARQAEGQIVAMVGDGINDAPVLSSAAISIAMGRGAALASSKADLILLNDNLASIKDLLSMAEATGRVIRQNICWALAYNLVALPAAVNGMIAPWMAAIGMSLSSLIVLLNSSRLAKAGA